MFSQIKITLCSDLCVSSGQGFSSVIDTDICYDSKGFPYIPARRIKGCLLEAANYIGLSKEKIDLIFGESGMGFAKSGLLYLSNGVLENYDSVSLALNGLSPAQVTEQFTYVRAQTAIKDDCAQENSLRFTRVIKQYKADGTPTVFMVRCECDNQKDELARLCSGLRHMGLMRTRGLGVVKCEFLQLGNESNLSISSSELFDANDKYEISYTVKLADPLMLSGASADVSCDFISGVNVLGSLARVYLKSVGKNAESDEFKDLFLTNKTIYSNLYIKEDLASSSVPAPMFFGKIKSGDRNDGKIVNMLDIGSDITAKPLKNGYMNNNFEKIEVSTETIYHNSYSGDKSKNLLYTQTCISAGQLFSGRIICDKKYSETLRKLLMNDDLRFGRSKTAQYSRCEILEAKPVLDEVQQVHFDKGDLVVAALESDLILMDQYGNYSVSLSLLINKLLSAIGIFDITYDKVKLNKNTVLHYNTVTGYNAKWNMRKPVIRAFAKGSVVIFTATNDFVCSNCTIRIGEKNNEGYGVVRFYSQTDIKYACSKYTIKPENQNADDDAALRQQNEILVQPELEAVRMDAINFAKCSLRLKDNNINAAFLGRVSLMLLEAKDIDDFCNRVNSIKDESKRKYILEIIEQRIPDRYWREYLTVIFTLFKYYLRQKDKAEGVTVK